MTQLYCLVQNNAVTQGPIPLPFSSGNITGLNVAPDPTIYGWYPYSDPGAPPFNPTLQNITSSLVIDDQGKTVTKTYAVNPKNIADVVASAPKPQFIGPLKYVATPPTCTGYVALYDNAGNAYKVMVAK